MDYIKNLNGFGELTNWTICLHGNGSSKVNEILLVNTKLNFCENTLKSKKWSKISLKVITGQEMIGGLEDSEMKTIKKSPKFYKNS